MFRKRPEVCNQFRFFVNLILIFVWKFTNSCDATQRCFLLLKPDNITGRLSIATIYLIAWNTWADDVKAFFFDRRLCVLLQLCFTSFNTRPSTIQIDVIVIDIGRTILLQSNRLVVRPPASDMPLSFNSLFILDDAHRFLPLVFVPTLILLFLSNNNCKQAFNIDKLNGWAVGCWTCTSQSICKL